MHRCSSPTCNMVGPCSCGYYHNPSMLFSMREEPDFCPYTSSPPSSSVDCTLSLGTPSTRLSNDTGKNVHRQPSNSSYLPNFCWDILQTKHTSNSPTLNKSARASNTSGGDPLVARRCANCDTTSTPLWRNGPRGPKSLCNACGIRFKKEERRATATSAGAPPAIMESQWGQYGQAAQKMPCLSPPFGNEMRFMENDDHEQDGNIHNFLMWRLNVTDRPGRVHDFTR